MSISLSQGMRNAVYTMTDMQSQIDTSNKRLATGKKINSALDNASAYFKAQNYQKDSRDLSTLLDGMDTGLRVITKTANALDSARKLLEAAQSIGRQASMLAAGDATRDTYGAQAAELLNQASKVMQDSGFSGTNLLNTGNGATALTVTTNLGSGAAATSITVATADMRFGQATGIGGAALASATHGMTATGTPETVAYTATATEKWGDATNGTAKITQFNTFVTNALTKIQAVSSAVAAQSSTIQIRQDFTKNWIRTNNEAADALTVADMNEEGANLSALQTKQQLAVQALSLAARADQAILRLF